MIEAIHLVGQAPNTGAQQQPSGMIFMVGIILFMGVFFCIW